jgi:hypothetical protein
LTDPAHILELIADLDVTGLAAVNNAIAARLLQLGCAAAPSGDDELLDARTAATMLNVSESYLYHHKLPFMVKIGTRRMFSRSGIARYIAKNTGKA